MPAQPYFLPRQFDSAMLAKQAIPGEPFIVIKALDVVSTSAFQFSDRQGRIAIFRYDSQIRAHVLKVPASLWTARNHAMAHDFLEQRQPIPLVVTVEVPTAEATSPIKGLIEALKADPEYAWGWHCNLAMAMHDSGAGPHHACNKGAALFLSLLSDGAVDTTQHPAYEQTQATIGTNANLSSQGDLESSDPHKVASGGSIPPPDTISAPSVADALCIEPMKAPPEMDAPGNSEEASDVVVGQVSEQPGASATFSTDGSGPTGNAPAPLYSRAWDMLESPMRLKELAATLETTPETLKASIQDPLSTVELGHAGWVKRRELT